MLVARQKTFGLTAARLPRFPRENVTASAAVAANFGCQPVSSATATPPAPRLASVARVARVAPVALRPALATDTGDAKADAMAAMPR